MVIHYLAQSDTPFQQTQWGTADADIKNPLEGAPCRAIKGSLFLTLEYEYIAWHNNALVTASSLLISTFLVQS